jgi:putative AbiEii toxin of type IV toxin-antitoxin system/AAA ATPase-like protein
MYLRRLRVQRLKLLRDVELDFSDVDGTSIRTWTVIIGKNGTGKTSLLQAIALAAAGSLQVNTLAGRTVGHLRDRRSREPLQVEASFEFPKAPGRARWHPLAQTRRGQLALTSTVSLADGETTIRAHAKYGPNAGGSGADPLDNARSYNTPQWFVAGYGVARFLPDVGRAPTLDRPSIERLQPLFDPMAALTSTNFSKYFGNDDRKARRFHSVLKRALINAQSILPDIKDLELRGKGGVTKPGDLLERDRFSQRVGTRDIKVPGLALAHGYQSTIAWIADLVGHVVFEAEADVEPKEMEGLVLVDEIDLYLHPVWQATLIPAIRKTFPKMQFIVTTHSPVVLSGVAPHEIVRVASWGELGDVLEVVHHPKTGELVPAAEVRGEAIRPDARMMTGSEIFREHFGLEGATPNPMGDELRRYTALAGDPFRSAGEQKEMVELGKLLKEHDVDPLPKVVPRTKTRGS